MKQQPISFKTQGQIFNKIAIRLGNQECADCKSAAPTWCSLEFGVFICLKCSGQHRSLGYHITRVKSTKLDSWVIQDIQLMESVGNKIANGSFEAKGVPTSIRPNIQTSDQRVKEFVREKYVQKKWADQTRKNPTEIAKDAISRGEEVFEATLQGGVPQQSQEKTSSSGSNFAFIQKKAAQPLQKPPAVNSKKMSEDLFEDLLDVKPNQTQAPFVNQQVQPAIPVSKANDELFSFDDDFIQNTSAPTPVLNQSSQNNTANNFNFINNNNNANVNLMTQNTVQQQHQQPRGFDFTPTPQQTQLQQQSLINNPFQSQNQNQRPGQMQSGNYSSLYYNPQQQHQHKMQLQMQQQQHQHQQLQFYQNNNNLKTNNPQNSSSSNFGNSNSISWA